MPLLTLRGDPQTLKEERKTELRLRIKILIGNRSIDHPGNYPQEIDEIIYSQSEFTELDFLHDILLSGARTGNIVLLEHYLNDTSLTINNFKVDESGDNFLHLICRSFYSRDRDLNDFLCDNFGRTPLDEIVRDLLLQRNDEGLTPLQVCAREVDAPTTMANLFGPLGDRSEREARYASMAKLSLPYYDSDIGNEVAIFNPYDTNLFGGRESQQDLMQPYRYVRMFDAGMTCTNTRD
ncbi:hypothetical protein SARC_16980 [Sphaeroforma arctica JP610]|uniref:Uncharacterized protein n=1 Tax=Sphaeroforma arctica JP610 TaxID=667725 RepID=A0A0L0F1B0_9EUKA|nr:hypothetical protein SARC_16980 [Sphaeroforma arctica JP610]KNC70487.1 hypothetical protein SARC_16980 [Sphaeroforma arctica JP610]|eukprot:XP_014144389.1 hypothetical protein SARC_16980 [Sphaeroforma arctica JP610]